MSLATVLSWSVPAAIRKRGAKYVQDGFVELTVCTAKRVEATVTGTEEYAVALDREDKLVWATCTCLYFSDRGEVCKHVWATVLAADSRGGLRGPRGGLPNELIAGSVEWAEDLADLKDEEEDRPHAEFPMSSVPLRQLPAPPAAPAPRPPGWREALAPLAAAVMVPPMHDGEILYVVDLTGSVQRQGLRLEVLTFRRKQDGSRGALKPLRISRLQMSTLRDSCDRELLSLLAGAIHGEPWSVYYAERQEIPSQLIVPDDLAPEVARRLCATGRCHLRSGPQHEIEEQPLRFDAGPPWELWLAVREEEDGACEVVPELRLGERRIDARVINLLPRAGLLFTRDVLARIDAGGAWRWLPLLRQAGPLRVPAAEREDFLAVLLAAADLPRLDLPAAMRVEEAEATPQPRLRLLPPPRQAYTFREWPEAKVSFLYAGRDVPASSGVRGVYEQETRRFLLRDRAAEERAQERLAALGFRPGAAEPPSREPFPREPVLRVPPSRVPEAVRVLLAEGWSVEAQGKLYRSPGQFEIRVASGIDWFELRGDVEFAGETVGLPQLLAAIRRGEGFVPLGDGSVGLLPEEWMKRWAPLAELGQADGDHLRFTVPQAVLLDAWLADEPTVTCDATFARARERLRGFAGIAPAAAPAGFRGTLRAYQEVGLGWLHFLRDFGLGGCLADDMGLGKTIQVLALLEDRRTLRAAAQELPLPPSLVVVPRSLVFNWLAEAAAFTPALRVRDHTGAGRAQDEAPFTDCDVMLITYGTLRRDIAVLKEAEFDYVILDEAQAIKNASSQTAKAARLLRGRHRLALTGTPIENHLGELWSLLEFLNPGFLGKSANGTNRGISRGARAPALRDPGHTLQQNLGRALRPLILRRTKQQVAPELPARVEQTLFCELPAKQRRLYDELREYYRAVLEKRIGDQGLGRAKFLALEALLRLRQAACHPALLDRGTADEPCAKLEALLPQLGEVLAEGHKALVFSQFTSFLALLRGQLERAGLPYLYLDGQTKDRQARVEEFQSNGCALFLISLKAGGLGLNLTAADYVYLLDPWWNPAVEAQAVDRAHRIGQARTVFAYRLVARDTVEEKILELQKGKRALADAIVQADQSLMAHLTREDLELLLS